jgi:DNA-binding NarL/FixJ family response regulator
MKELVRVLLVDKENAQRKSIEKTLKAESRLSIAGIAASGYEAITKAITLTPCVVLMNVSIETEMAGVFACREIIKNLPEAKVILYGRDCPDNILFKAFQMGAINFLAGDYAETELISAILDADGGKSPIHHNSAARLIKEFKRIINLQDNLVYVFNVFIKLTPAEINILKHFYNGMRSQEIAKILFIGNSTIKTHISNILRKFNLETMSQVVEVLRSTEIFSMISQNIYDM